MPAVHPFPELLSIYHLKLLLYQSYFFLSATAQLNSDTKSIIQLLGNITTPNNSEGIIHANWPDNMVPVAIRVKKYDQWRYNVLGMALYGKELYLIEVPSAYQGCPCEVICYKSN